MKAKYNVTVVTGKYVEYVRLKLNTDTYSIVYN